MDKFDEILRALGRIEGELVEIGKLSERVRTLEVIDLMNSIRGLNGKG